MAAKIILLLFFVFDMAVCENYSVQYLSDMGEKVELKFYDCVYYLTRALEGFNDRRWGTSELGKILHYGDMKPKIDDGARSGKSMKKMSMAMMPLIFHMGASSTWMLLTSIMAVKSVAIGIILLVFKIAVSVAKVSSFFTTMKAKHAHHYPQWSGSPPEHGYDRRFYRFAPAPVEWSPYNHKWSDNVMSQDYKSIPLYRNNAIESYDRKDSGETDV